MIELPPIDSIVTVNMGDTHTYVGKVVGHAGECFLLKVQTITEEGVSQPFPDVEPVLCHHSKWIKDTTTVLSHSARKQRIADHFNIDVNQLSYVNGSGWFYNYGGIQRLLHHSLYELQHTPAWATKQIANLWIADR